jgi:hypothetical protein
MEQRPLDILKLEGLVSQNAILSLVSSAADADYGKECAGAQAIVDWLQANLKASILQHVQDIIKNVVKSRTTKFIVGEQVCVTNSGCQYNSMVKWIHTYMPSKYTWGPSANPRRETKQGDILTVAVVEPHPDCHHLTVYGLIDSNNFFYMLDERGLVLV